MRSENMSSNIVRKVLLVLVMALAVVLFVGCACAGVGDDDGTDSDSPSTDPETLTKITITGIAVPKFGDTPDYSADVSETNLSVSSVSWSPEGSTFAAETKYRVTVMVTVSGTGKIFSEKDKLSATIDGKQAEISNSNDSEASITYEYPATSEDPDIIKNVKITGITSPKTGDKPATISNLNVDPSSSVEVKSIDWEPSVDSTFEANQEYTVTISVKPKEGKKFSPSVSATIGGNDASKITRNETEFSFKYEYQKTEAELEPISAFAITGIAAPETGGKPVAAADVVIKPSASLTVKSVTWTPNVSSKFEASQKYTVTVVVNTKGENKFGQSVAATIGGKDAVVTRDSDTAVSVKFEFPETGDSSSKITKIEIKDIEKPVKGGSPDKYCEVSSTPSKAVSDVATINWSLKGKAGYLGEAEKFADGKTYVAKITLSPLSGFKFDGEPTVTVNGEKATSVTVKNDEVTITQEFSIDSDNKVVDIINVDGIPVPVHKTKVTSPKVTVGASSTNESAVDSSVYDFGWYSGGAALSSEATYEGGKKYTAEFKIKPKTGFVFKENATVNANGSDKAEIRLNNDDDNSAKVIITYTASGGVISTIKVKDIDMPVYGGFPDVAGTVETKGLKINTIKWLDGDGDEFKSTSSFTKDVEYTVVVTVDTEEGYELAETIKSGTINGTDATVKRESSSKATLSFKFPKTGTALTSAIKLELDEPSVDEDLDKYVDIKEPEKGISSAKVTWDPDDTVAKADTAYTAKIELVPDSTITFTPSTEVMLNGIKLSSSELKIDANGHLIITKKFNKNIISEVDLTITQPSEGKKPDTYAVSSTTGVEKNNKIISWHPDVEKTFDAKYNYQATITVKAQSGYTFSSNPKVYVNDKLATVKNRVNDKELEVQSPFLDSSGITEVEFTITEPKTGERAATPRVVKPSSGVDIDVSWDPELANGKFLDGYVYVATIELKSTEDELFTSTLEIRMNGDKLSKDKFDIAEDKKSVLITYAFTQTVKTATPTKTPTPKPTVTNVPRPDFTDEPVIDDWDDEDDGSGFTFPNPLKMLNEFIQLFFALFDPATYGGGDYYDEEWD